MLGPADYWSAFDSVADPLDRAMRGFAFGDAAAQAQQQRELQQQQIEAAKQRFMLQQQERQRFFALDRPTGADYMRFVASLDPKDREGIKGGWDAMTSEQQNNDFAFNAKLAMAFKSDKPEVAKLLAEERAAALRNGRNEAAAKEADTFAKLIDREPEFARRITTSRLFAIDEKRAKALFDDERATDLQPAAVEKAQGEAAKATSDAEKAAVDAEFARPKNAAELKEMAARFGLTTAQTNQALALTRKYDAETQKLALEAITGDPTKNFEFEKKLRDEYMKDSAGFRDTKDQHARIMAADESAVGDIALIFGYMKMLDPASVVREGEFDTAQKTAGIPDRVWGALKRVESGQRLTADQRKQFKSQASSLYMAASQRDAEARKRISNIASKYKLDTSTIFGDEAAAEPQGAAAATTRPQAAAVSRPASPAGTTAAPAASSGGWSVRRIN